MKTMNYSISTLKSKNQLNLAFNQAIEERKDFFDEIIAEVMEDIALGIAIEIGLNSERVSEEEVLKALRSK